MNHLDTERINVGENHRIPSNPELPALVYSRALRQEGAGIGFLGAGAILHRSGVIHGMTTAATIWATGMSLLIRLVLSIAPAVENRTLGNVRDARVDVAFA